MTEHSHHVSGVVIALPLIAVAGLALGYLLLLGRR